MDSQTPSSISGDILIFCIWGLFGDFSFPDLSGPQDSARTPGSAIIDPLWRTPNFGQLIAHTHWQLATYYWGKITVKLTCFSPGWPIDTLTTMYSSHCIPHLQLTNPRFGAIEVHLVSPKDQRRGHMRWIRNLCCTSSSVDQAASYHAC